MDGFEKGQAFRPRTGKAASGPLLVETDVYLHLLVLIFLLDQEKYRYVG